MTYRCIDVFNAGDKYEEEAKETEASHVLGGVKWTVHG